MAQRYESVSEIQEALKKRRIRVSREGVEAALAHLGLHEPLGPGDLAELVDHLGPQHVVNQRVLRTEGILSSKKWAEAVRAVRLELGLPATGISVSEARELHLALLDTVLGKQPTLVKIGVREEKLATLFWGELVSEARRLCALLEINPDRLDDIRTSYACGAPDVIWGVRKLLNPEASFKLDGREFPFQPGQTDHLLAHLLWGLPLDPKVMEPKPSVTYQWKRLADGSGRFLVQVFNEENASAAELREMKRKVRDIKRGMEDLALLAMSHVGVWEGITWEQRWRNWNRIFPDFTQPTPGALRKAYEYAVKNRAKIRARFEALCQIPNSRSWKTSPGLVHHPRRA